MRVPSALTATVLTLGLAAGAPASAQAAPPPPLSGTCQFTNGDLGASELVVGGTHVRYVNAYITALDCGTFDASNAPYLDFGLGVGGYLTQPGPNPEYLTGTPGVDPAVLSTSDAGQELTGYIRLSDGTTRAFPGRTLTLKRKSTLDVDAPSKVKKSKSFVVEGYFQRADWDSGEYVEVESKKVRLEASTYNAHWKPVKTVTSGRGAQGGGLSYKAKIKKETCFRWVYDGSSTTGESVSDSNCVKIKK